MDGVVGWLVKKVVCTLLRGEYVHALGQRFGVLTMATTIQHKRSIQHTVIREIPWGCEGEGKLGSES